MKAIKTLLAVSVLAAAGIANAATVATFNVAESADLSAAAGAGSTLAGAGTATLSDTGVLSITILGLTQTLPVLGIVAHIDEFDTLNGHLTGTSFAWTTGSKLSTNCSGTGPAFLVCNNMGPQPSVFAPDVNPIALNTANGAVSTFTNTTLQQGNTIVLHYSLTSTTPTVPVPAAAWLFGSGLLGLAGTARRRRS